LGLFNPWGQENWETFAYANHLNKEFMIALVNEFKSEERRVAYAGNGYLLLQKGKAEGQGEKTLIAPEIKLFLERLQLGLRNKY